MMFEKADSTQENRCCSEKLIVRVEPISGHES